MFDASRGWHLVRIWNYVPAINEPGFGELENYRIFCRGRSLAFEQRFGQEYISHVPAGSAVGRGSEEMVVIFAASRSQPRHVENPLQVPAYEYPASYGPRPPVFARATVVRDSASVAVFISGTAAIRGHATVAPHSTLDQLDCTIENLREISAACGLDSDLGARCASQRHFKVYLRKEADQPSVASALEARLFESGDHVSYLRADLCREPLQVEIEATIHRPPTPADDSSSSTTP
jgi:hypothetical protein